MSLLSIFNVFEWQLYIQVGLDLKCYPLKARTPVIAACSYIIIIIIIFCPKTDRAAQTVRPRDLKLGQIVELFGENVSKSQPNRPIGGATAQNTKFSDVFGHSSYTICRRLKNLTSLRSLGQNKENWTATDFLYDARFFRKIEWYPKPTFAN